MLDFIFRVDPGGGDGLFRSVPSNVGSCRGYIHHIPLKFRCRYNTAVWHICAVRLSDLYGA